MLEGEVLQAGLTTGAAGDDHGLVGGDAAAHQQRADLIKGLEFVGILFGLIGVVRFRECLPGDVLGPRDVAVADEGLIRALELGLGARIDNHHTFIANQGLQFAQGNIQAPHRGGLEATGGKGGEGLGGALRCRLVAAEAPINNRHLADAALLQDVRDQGRPQHVITV